MKTLSPQTEREKRKSFQSGVKAAAMVADRFNDAFLGPYRLGDCVENQLTSNKVKMPRRNKPTEKTHTLARQLLLGVKETDEALVRLARVIAPDCWEAFEQAKGKVRSELTEWECTQSLRTAKAILAAGYRACAPQEPLPAFMQGKKVKRALRT